MRVVLFATDEFAIAALEELAGSTFDLVAVVTNPDKPAKRGRRIVMPPVKERSISLGVEVYQPESLKSADALKRIASYRADAFVVVSYGKFLPKELLSMVDKRFNIHPSLLPLYRGASPIQYALLNGDSHTGVSIIDVTDKMDAGDIYMQWVERVEEDDNYLSLSKRLSLIGARMLICTLELAQKGTLKGKKQKEERATYTKIIKKSDGRVEFESVDASRVINMTRAFYPWPGVYFIHKGKQFKIIRAHFVDVDGRPGTVVKVSKGELVIACRSGAISIDEIQPESKKPMDIRAFLAGYRFEAGETIG